MGEKTEVPVALDHGLTLAFFSCIGFTVYALSSDRESLLIFAGLLVATAFMVKVSKFIFNAIGVFISSTFLTGPPFHDPMKKNLIAKKWREQSWQLTIHVSMTLFELYVLRDETWWDSPADCWTPYPAQQEVKFSLRMVYLTQLAIWIYTCFSHRFLEPRRKDYVEMYVHHIATILLVAGSYHGGNLRIGLIVLFLHDISDIPIDTMKMVNYLKLEDGPGFFLSEVCFVGNAISWVYFRLYYFPFRIIKSTLFDAHLSSTFPGQLAKDLFPEHTKYWLLSNVLLLVLLCLHCFWFWLMLKIGYKVVFGNRIHQAGNDEYEGASSDADSVSKED